MCILPLKPEVPPFDKDQAHAYPPNETYRHVNYQVAHLTEHGIVYIGKFNLQTIPLNEVALMFKNVYCSCRYWQSLPTKVISYAFSDSSGLLRYLGL